jgi:hypothetical protein
MNQAKLYKTLSYALVLFTILGLLVYYYWLKEAGGGGVYNEFTMENEKIDNELGADELTDKEKELKDKIVAQEGLLTLTATEWKNTYPTLMKKLQKKAKISDAQLLNDYKNKNSNYIIRELNKKAEQMPEE